MTNLLLACGAVAGPLLVAVFTREGAKRPGYDPIREQVSTLALGERGWTQRANCLATAALMLAFSAGLRRAMPDTRLGPRLVATCAVGLVGVGVFVMDPVTDPPDAPEPEPSLQGTLHNASTIVVFGALEGACLTLARRFARSGQPWWATYSAVSVLVAGGIGLFGRRFGDAIGLVHVAGLNQRLTIVIGWGWLAALAVHLLRHPEQRRV